MSFKIAEGFVEVDAKTDGMDRDIKRGFDRAGGSSATSAGRKAGSSWVKGMGMAAVAGVAAVGVAAGAGLAKVLVGSVAAASDLNETMSKTGVVFKSSAQDVLNWSKTSATAMGMSRQAALDGASSFGAYLTQIGIAPGKAASMSKSWVQLSSDLASFNNVDPTEALEAMNAAMIGEYDSIQRLIPGLSAATVQTEAMRLTGKKNADQLTDQDKALALNSLMLKNSSQAQGDFARTSGGLANQQRILSAQWQDAKAKLGQVLLPAVLAVVRAFNDFFPVAIEKTKAAWAAFKEAIPPVIAFVKRIIAMFSGKGGGESLGGLPDKVREIWSQVRDIFVTYLALIRRQIEIWVAVIKYIWKNYGDIILKLVISVWNAVASFIQGVLKVIQGILNIALGILTGDWRRAWTGVKQVFSGVWQAIKAIFRLAWAWIEAAIRAGLRAYVALWRAQWNAVSSIFRGVWNGIKSFFAGIWSWIKSTVSGGMSSARNAISSGWNAAKSMTSSAWNSIRNAVSNGITNAVNVVRGLPGRARAALGNLGSVLWNAGASLIQGLINGITSKLGALRSKVSEAAGAVRNFWPFSPAKEGPLRRYPMDKAGANIVTMLTAGMKDKQGALRGQVAGLAGMTANVGGVASTSSMAAGSGLTIYGDVRVEINASDLREMKDVHDFFARIKMDARKGVTRQSTVGAR